MNSREFNHTVVPLAERIFPMVARMLKSEANAEDAVQDIMLKLWQVRKKVGKHPNPAGFVFRIAKNHCIDLQRRKKLAIQPYDAIAHDQRHSYMENGNDYNELKVNIEAILQELPDMQAEVLMLRDLDQLEFIEIAGMLDIKIENVRMLLSRARKKMAEKLSIVYNYEAKERKSTGA